MKTMTRTNLTALRCMIENYYANAAIDYGVRFDGVDIWEDSRDLCISAREGNTRRLAVMPSGVYTAEEAFYLWMDYAVEFAL